MHAPPIAASGGSFSQVLVLGHRADVGTSPAPTLLYIFCQFHPLLFLWRFNRGSGHHPVSGIAVALIPQQIPNPASVVAFQILEQAYHESSSTIV